MLVPGFTFFEALILPRWAVCVFGVGAVASLAYALLPHALEPLAAVPVGVGLAGLGYALWSERREAASQSVPARERPQRRSAQLQSRRIAGNRMEGTSGRTAAWLLVDAIVTRYVPFALLTLLTAGPIQEELGWRGFALPRLQARLGPAAGTAAFGAVWAAWHLPNAVFRGWDAPTTALFLLATVLTAGWRHPRLPHGGTQSRGQA